MGVAEEPGESAKFYARRPSVKKADGRVEKTGETLVAKVSKAGVFEYSVVQIGDAFESKLIDSRLARQDGFVDSAKQMLSSVESGSVVRGMEARSSVAKDYARSVARGLQDGAAQAGNAAYGPRGKMRKPLPTPASLKLNDSLLRLHKAQDERVATDKIEKDRMEEEGMKSGILDREIELARSGAYDTVTQLDGETDEDYEARVGANPDSVGWFRDSSPERDATKRLFGFDEYVDRVKQSLSKNERVDHYETMTNDDGSPMKGEDGSDLRRPVYRAETDEEHTERARDIAALNIEIKEIQAALNAFRAAKASRAAAPVDPRLASVPQGSLDSARYSRASSLGEDCGEAAVDVLDYFVDGVVETEDEMMTRLEEDHPDEMMMLKEMEESSDDVMKLRFMLGFMKKLSSYLLDVEYDERRLERDAKLREVGLSLGSAVDALVMKFAYSLISERQVELIAKSAKEKARGASVVQQPAAKEEEKEEAESSEAQEEEEDGDLFGDL